MARNRNRKNRNPLLAAAVLAPTVGQLIKESKRSTSAPTMSKALVPYKPPTLAGPSRTEQKAILRGADAQLVAAPVATAFMCSGPNWTFSAAPVRNGQTGVRLSGKQLWANVQSNATPDAGKPIYPLSATNVSTLTFDPDDTKTMPPPMTALAQVFGRYSLKKCDVLYTPAVGTSLNVGLSAYVNSDAGLIQNSGSTTDWSQTIMEQSNSVMGPVWQAFRLRVPCDDTLRYTYQSVSDATLTVAEERQDHAFGLGMSFTQSPATSTKYGFLHIDYVIDFYEVISQANETSLLKAERRLLVLRERVLARREEKSERKEEKRFDDIVLVEQMTPPPSARGTLTLADVTTLKRGASKVSSAKG